MAFVDCVTTHLIAGHGGAGAVAWRREKFVEFGGPSGGNGGRGGSIVLIADRNVGTLTDLRYRKEIRAGDGKPGQARLKDGPSADDIIIRVPVGTLVRDAVTTEILADLADDGATYTAAVGGIGGRGNASFKSSTNQSPTYSQPGIEGTERTVTLELKLLADVALVGYPSVGKSTLISVVSNARPKIAAYPFTTLRPNLGIVSWRDHEAFVLADIPGLIEGAHEGHGLGIQFLRHIERCRAICHLIEVTPPFDEVDDGRDPIRDFERITHELAQFSESLAARPVIVALAKIDLPFARDEEDRLRAHFEGLGVPFYAFSAVTRDGLTELVDAMGTLAIESPPPEQTHFTAPAPVAPRVDVDEVEDETEDNVVYVGLDSDSETDDD